MDLNVVRRNFSVDEFDSVAPEVGSDITGFTGEMSTNGETVGELGRASQVLTRLELNLACSSEKLLNLSILTMHVDTQDTDFENSDFENSDLERELTADSVERALEFDLLSGFLDSEVREVDKFIGVLKTELVNGRELISSFKHLGDTFCEMEQKLLGSEESLKNSQEQISELRIQSTKYQRTLQGEENRNGDGGIDVSEDAIVSPKIKMQTAEQKRQFLRMLEKSLARELDLEKKLAESRQTEEELNHRLISSEQEIYSLEEDVADVYGRFLEADNEAEVLKGVSKELWGQVQILQLNMKGSIQRESELRSRLEISMERLDSKEGALQKLSSGNVKLSDFLMAQVDSLKDSLMISENKPILAESEVFTLREKVSLLEQPDEASDQEHNELSSEFSEMEKVVQDLKDKFSRVEFRAERAEAKCKLLSETNMELNDELGLLKDSGVTVENVNSLEKQLKESDVQLRNAVASFEASQEKQNMLNSTISDMEILIENLKSRVSKAESRADTTEEKCIVLSEENSDLSDELNFLKGKVNHLEASLYQVEETKTATVRNIGIQTSVIANLIVQLAFERERLHKQISSLVVENKFLKLQKTKKDLTTSGHNNCGKGEDFVSLKPDLTTTTSSGETHEEVNEGATTVSKPHIPGENVDTDEPGAAHLDSELDSVRRVDIGMFSFKHVFVAMLIILVSAAVYLFQNQNDSSF